MEHVSVLLHEAVDSLAVKPDGIYVDLTLGRAGHSSLILSQLTSGHLYGFDLDETAIEESRKKLEAINPSSFTLIHGSFATLKSALAEHGVTQVDGILADLGVSSPQFDDGERGFSYRYDARLDMRMDRSSPLTAYEVVNTYEERRLADILSTYGDEPDSRRIASAIVKARANKPIETTFDLVEVIKRAKPAKALSKKGHPAKQAFQALRIEVNGELDSLKKMLDDAPGMLRSGGRLSIITFMSLDDRVVKQTFHRLTVIEGSRHGVTAYPQEIARPDYETLTRKPILPSEEELASNPRSASAKLRVLIKK